VKENEFTVVTAKDWDDLPAVDEQLAGRVWPAFMLHDAVSNRLWSRLYTVFPEYQFALLEIATDRAMAVVNSLPLTWDGEPEDLPDDGWDWALETGFLDQAEERAPRTQCALSIAVAPEFQGKGLSAHALKAMKSIGQAHGLNSLVAPVRPSLKSRYPLTPIEDYTHWKNEQGLPFDPWLRVHARQGAEIIRVCPRSMRIEGSIADWESWAGMVFPESGQYIVPGALVPVEMVLEKDRGIYIEPNVWMHHPL
jgi:GNAT superfamily N-acetyltransferase